MHVELGGNRYRSKLTSKHRGDYPHMTKRYFEDIDVGTVFDLGHFSVTRDDILEFAERYDPQPIHVDPEVAEESIYGGLIASGWHTGSLCMRQLANELMNDAASLGSFGLEELRWRKPLRPGDTVFVESEILDKRRSESHDDRGYISNELRGKNAEGELVISWRATNIFLRRDYAESAD